MDLRERIERAKEQKKLEDQRRLKRIEKKRIKQCVDFFSANEELEKMKAEWKASGTKVIDMVGAFFALDLEDGQVIFSYEDGYIISETFAK